MELNYTISCKNIAILISKIENLPTVLHKANSSFICLVKKKVSIFEELEVFDKLYGKYGLKSKGWSKFSAG